MSDLKTSIELDTERFERAMKRVTEATDRIGKRTKAMDAEGGPAADRFAKRITAVAASFFTIEKAMQAMNRVWSVGERAIDAYNDRFEGMETNTRAMKRATDDLLGSLGQQLDLIAGTLGLVDRLEAGGGDSGLIDRIGLRTQMTLRFFQDWFTDGRAGAGEKFVQDILDRVDRTQAEATLLNDKLAATLEQVSLQDIDSAIIRAEMGGPSQSLRVIELELQQAEARIRRQSESFKDALGFMGPDGNLLGVEGSPFDAEQLRTIFDKVDEVTQRALDTQRQLSEIKKRDDERSKAFDEEADALRRRSLEVQTMALEGQDKAAALARVRLNFDREELKIRKELAGVDEDRLATELDFLAAQERRQIAATARRLDAMDRIGPQTERTAAIGVLGGRRLVVQQLGADHQATTAQSAQQIAKQLESVPGWFGAMIRAIQGQPGATFQ